MELNSEQRAQTAYEALLLAYAAGALDQAQRFAVSAHMTLSPSARRFVQACECIGGSLLERECAPVAMRADSLGRVLDRLDALVAPPPAPHRVRLPQDIPLPLALLESLACRPCGPDWSPLAEGLDMFDLPLECRHSHTRFFRAHPAVRIPRRPQRTMEITLVLRGAFHDDFGMHRSGELMVIDEDYDCAPLACRENGAITMVVSSDSASGLAALLRRFLGR